MMAGSTGSLQSEAGYIDARPQIRQIDENLLRRTAGPYMWVTSFPPRFSHFRSTPKSRHCIAAQYLTRCAKRGQSAAQQKYRLFDQLVRDAEQTRGDGEPERLGSLHVNGQLEFGRLQNRQIGRFFAHQNLARESSAVLA